MVKVSHWKFLKQLHNLEIIYSIYNKYHWGKECEEEQEHIGDGDGENTTHRKVNKIHRWWRLNVKIWGECKKYLKRIIFKNIKKIEYNLTLKSLIL